MKDATTQAGFSAESMPAGVGERPILFMDGERAPYASRQGRTVLRAGTVANRYRELMEAARTPSWPRRRGPHLSPRPTEPALLHRGRRPGDRLDELERGRHGHSAWNVCSAGRPKPPGRWQGGSPQGLWRTVRGHAPMLAFHLADVRPAIAARRKSPGEDVISHLLAQGYAEPAILIECVTYGAAGMATTREFISMAVLHLLADADLRARYLAADEPERFGILHEILRLEPIIGHLYRRATRD